jgi:hypothetical protein
VHSNCGQACGQHLGAGRKWPSRHAPDQNAAFFSAGKFIQIKHLQDGDGSMTLAAARSDAGRRVVDFRERALD